jgi:hypothetical protein
MLREKRLARQSHLNQRRLKKCHAERPKGAKNPFRPRYEGVFAPLRSAQDDILRGNQFGCNCPKKPVDTWQMTMRRLAARSDAVLITMDAFGVDLRSFSPIRPTAPCAPPRYGCSGFRRGRRARCGPCSATCSDPPTTNDGGATPQRHYRTTTKAVFMFVSQIHHPGDDKKDEAGYPVGSTLKLVHAPTGES